MRFVKMHGLGNDYVFVDCFEQTIDDVPRVARFISDRHTGVGSDGLILIKPSERAAVRMEMYNADGSRGQTCGNGLRCVAKYAFEAGLAKANRFSVETDAGLMEVECFLRDGLVRRVKAEMGKPSLVAKDLPCSLDVERLIEHPIEIRSTRLLMTCVSIGNPHAVVFVDDVAVVPLDDWGPALESVPMFPERINVHFAEVVASDHLRIRTWERGSGATQACGSGACAVLVAATTTERTGRRATITLPGGDLWVEWFGDNRLYQIGPAVEVFRGEWPA